MISAWYSQTRQEEERRNASHINGNAQSTTTTTLIAKISCIYTNVSFNEISIVGLVAIVTWHHYSIEQVKSRTRGRINDRSINRDRGRG